MILFRPGSGQPWPSGATAFSLVEVVIAIGVVSFAMLTLIALLPIGLRSERTSFKESEAINLIHAVATDLANTPPKSNGTNNFSSRFGLPLPGNSILTTTNTIYVNDSERVVTTASAGTFGLVCLYSPPLNSGITAPPAVEVQVYWPANATPGNSQGSVESYLTFPQNLP